MGESEKTDFGSRFSGVDEYARRARVWPVLLVCLPIALGVIGLAGAPWTWASVVWGAGLYCGVAYLLSQLGRDMGKRKEPALHRHWGGCPSVSRLRHRDARNTEVLRRRHQKLWSVVPEVRLPTREEEEASPAEADAKYEACVVALVGATRGKNRFRLLFEENCSYGFRRNLWGMKPVGVVMAGLSVGAMSARGGWVLGNGERLPPELVGSLAGCTALLLVWVVVIRPGWVRVPSEGYADRLMEALESL